VSFFKENPMKKKAVRKRLTKARLATVGDIIRVATLTQVYDSMYHNDLAELSNEAWVEVLEVLRADPSISDGEVFRIAERAIIHFKQWQRCSLTVPKTSPHRVLENVALSSLVAVSDDALEQVGHRPDFERLYEIREVMAGARKVMPEPNRIVMDLLMSGFTKTEIWKFLMEDGWAMAKEIAFRMQNLRTYFGKKFGLTRLD
jgi:hypothetical protein